MWAVVATIALLPAANAFGQSFHKAGSEFNAVRSVTIPTGKGYTIAVTEFFHHGEIHSDGSNVVVIAKNKELTPVRILQLGPGDFCRLAFQVVKGQAEYEIFYGGEKPTEELPKWTSQAGLLLETRQFKHVDLNNLDSVRKGFESAQPIGADYVETVFHAENPFSLKREPFLSRYTGHITVPTTATYGFFTPSQDCSFLLIDDKLVASEPGRHGPTYHARPGTRHDVKLESGWHKFEYYHAAAGGDAMMVADWEPEPATEKPKQPVMIPAAVFGSDTVVHVPVGSVSLRTTKAVPDFLVKIAGEVPLPGNDTPLIRVQFQNISPKPLMMGGAKIQWDFGDGQTSEQPETEHVYLRPGMYSVTLSVRHGGPPIAITNKLYVDRPHLTHKDKPDSLDDYLGTIEKYDVTTLDAASLRQLALALEAKAIALENPTEEEIKKSQAAAEEAGDHAETKKETGRHKKSGRDDAKESDRYWKEAVAVGKTALTKESAAKGDADLLKLAQLVGPIARQRLGDSETASQIWLNAAERIATSAMKAECKVAAADIAINDLLDPTAAKKLLDDATERLGKTATGSAAASLQRVWGDYHAAMGDGAAARKAYAEAERFVASQRRFSEKTAWRGAHARSTEEFIKLKQYDRAVEEILAWQADFPIERIEGYQTLLYARYWAGREKDAQAVAQADQLFAVHPNSPYIDQALMVSADCDIHQGRKERALATLHTLLKDYPGSPLVPLAKTKIEALESEGQSNK
jgi:predicted negative regulator of RcsB-dependent stress response